MKNKLSSHSSFYLFIPSLTVLLLDSVLRITTKQNGLSENAAAGNLLAVFPLLITAAALHFVRNRRVSRGISIALTEIVILIDVFCFFMYDAYKVFMPPSIVLSEAGNAVSDFGASVVSSIIRGIPYILLYHLPLLLFLIGEVRFSTVKKAVFTGGAAVLALVLALMLGKGFENAELNTFHSDVCDYGAFFALGKELKKSIFPDLGSGSDYYIAEIAEKSDTAEESDPAEALTDAAPAGGVNAETEASEPVTTPVPVNIPETVPEEPVVYESNTLELDFEKLSQSSKTDSIAKYIKTVEPTMKNQYTGIFKGKNLILITAEAFSKQVIDPEITPTLYRLANSGIVFEEFYQPAWGGSTSTGEFSWITGLAPLDPSIMSLTKKNALPFTMGNTLMREGYFSAAYHNGSYTYYNRNNTHLNLGYESFTGIGNGMENGLSGGVFPESDREMIDYTVPLYIDKQPFSIYYMTISAHSPYTFKVGANDMAVKNKAFGEKYNVSEQVQAYYACNQELESALTSLVSQLEEAGIADDTVIALVADHYPYGLLPSNAWGGTQNLLNELYGYAPDTCRKRDLSAAIIWCGSLEKRDEPIVVSKPASSLDILPTLLNLFGAEYDSRLLAGRDLLSDCDPLVFWNDACWVTDKGSWDTQSGVYTPAEGCEYDESYAAQITAEVKNRLKFSSDAVKTNFYNYMIN